MLRSAFNYFTSDAAGDSSSCATDGASLSSDGGGSSGDRIVGSIVDVGGTGVRVKRRIGEGGFAFVYAVEQTSSATAGMTAATTAGIGRNLALKRLLAVDAEKRAQIVQEITFLKNLKPCPGILQFYRAANLQNGFSATKCEEFLLLTELCTASLYDCLSTRVGPYPPETVGRIFFQALEAVAFMHRASPPIIHRDLKPENLLIDASGNLKLCDFGSATTSTFVPDDSWNMQRRTSMEEELAKFTTPMYRAPEVVDCWSNFPVGPAADVWAMGCVLYQLCFHRHPFEDGAKLRIINANYSMPEGNSGSSHHMFHDLVKQMFAVDPSCRPSCPQVQEHLGQIGVLSGWDLEGKIDFERKSAVQQHQQQSHQPPTTPIDDHHQLGGGFPSHQQQQQQHHSSSSSSSTSSNLISSIRGGIAGSSVLLRNIKESTRGVVSSLLSSKDLDLHLLTGRIAAMSFPADGIDLAYKNQLEDVKQIMESRHGGHYAFVNLSEKKYPASRLGSQGSGGGGGGGRLIDPDWTSQVPPSVQQVLEATMQCLEFLGQNRQNVLVLHCLDGRANTAVLFAAVMVVGRVFTRCKDALALFARRRCEPLLGFGHRSVLRQLEKLLSSAQQSPSQLQLQQLSATVTSVILEPVPLFTKALDGVRPFVDVYSNGKLVGSSLKDYASLKMFTPYDCEVVLRLPGGGIKVPMGGDVAVVVYHARQSIAGSFFSGGGQVERVKICQVYFNPAYVTANRTHVRFPGHELDSLHSSADAQQRIPHDFSVSVNFTRNESRTCTFPYALPEKRKLDLIFQSKAEFEEAMEATSIDAATRAATRMSSNNPEFPPDIQMGHEEPPKRPPREKKPASPVPPPHPHPLLDISAGSHMPKSTSESSHLGMPKPASFADIARHREEDLLGLGAGGGGRQRRLSSSLLDLGPTSTQHSDDDAPIVENIFPSEKPPGAMPAAAAGNDDDVLLDFGGGSRSSSLDHELLSNVASPGDHTADLLGGFASAAPPPRPRVPQPMGPKPAPSSSSSHHDFFGSSSSSGMGDLLAPMKQQQTHQRAPSPKVSDSQRLIDDMLDKLDVGDKKGAATTAAAGAPKAAAPAKANYSSAFFQANPPNNGRVSASKATFDDLLGGFTSSSEAAGRTIGEMKKAVDKKYMDPVEAQIFEWKDGKSRNLRALLCSLHTVIWEGSRWEKCGMHQLVTHADVKKMYRKACLAVHPDKQTGSENESLSKLIFTELNDGWSKFQEDEQAS